MIPFKRLAPFGFAGLMGLAAVAGMQHLISKERRALQTERAKLYADYQEPVEVIVARKDIPEGTTITADHLGRVNVPKKFVQPYATSRGVEVLGLVTRTPIAEHEQILSNKLQRPEEAQAGASLSEVTPKGKRAVTIGADLLTGVGGFVRPGDAVDLVWSFQAPAPSGQKGELVTITLFQNVRVLAIDRQMVGTAEGEQKAPANNYSLTLALTPQEAQVLLYAREQGQVQVSLRPHEEKEQQVAVVPVDSAMVMQAVLGPEATPPPSAAPPRTVEVFKGLERSLVTVNE